MKFSFCFSSVLIHPKIFNILNVVTLHTQVVYTFSKQLWGLHSPSTCLVQNFLIFTGDNFFHTYTLHTCFRVHSPYSYLVYTLQAHVRFKIFKFSREIIFSCLHSPHIFQDSLSIQLFGLHSPSTCLVQNFQIFTRDHFFILTLSTHVSGFTLHTVTLQAHVMFKINRFSREFIFSSLHSPHMFQDSLSIQLFG